MQDRPTVVPTQQTLQSKPTALFSMLSHDKKRVIGGGRKIPTTIALTRQTQKTMEKIVSRIGVGLDVVKQNPRRPLQFRQSEGAIQPFHQAITLGNGLGNENSSDVPVLFAKPFHLNG
jgi:signal recognition particle subunit SEC65